MKNTKVWRDWMLPFLVVSAAYIFAFVITIYGLLPLQAAYTPDLEKYASLLFLPHGVRVLSAWLLGWRSIPLIAPAALYTHFLNFGADGFTVLGSAGAMSSVVGATLCFWLLAKFGMDFRISTGRNVHWRDVMLAGFFASIVNTVGMGYVYHHSYKTMTSYLIGDVSGLFACMFVLMLVFKMLRGLQATKLPSCLLTY
ncbi:hypothetical protein [Pseudorhodobacter ferrugineus]|uniref:hypothetical protein n=1 Tax=Pseudorhodobacter ferrugineus TaxID=77008 RepID=UPI0003FB1C7B|nr:hypothetical protein [Pseudorhodobacter ferrugineus]